MLARLERPLYSLNKMEIKRNINYFKNLCLDIFVSEKSNDKCFVHFHGGGIVEGDKTDCDNLMKHMANHGFTMVNVNYSLYPNTKFPEFLKEAAKAVRYAYDNISKNIYISGQSAGAYITMMLCLNNVYLNEVGLSPLDIKGYVSDSGQMSDHFNVQHYENNVDPWLQRISEFAPLYYVNQDVKASPILLIYYSNDMLNRKEQNLMLFNLVKYYNPSIDITALELEGNHVEGSTKLDKDNEYPYVKEIMKWIKSR